MTLKERELICFCVGIQGSIHSTTRTIRFISLKFSTNKVQWFFFASLKGNFEWQPGLFPFNKKSGLKFQKIHAPNGKVYSGCTDPTEATAGLVIILVSRTRSPSNLMGSWQDAKERYWRKQFCQMERDISTEMRGSLFTFPQEKQTNTHAHTNKRQHQRE